MNSGQSFTGWLPLQKEHTCAREQPLSVQRPQFQSLQIGLLMCTLNLAEGRTSDMLPPGRCVFLGPSLRICWLRLLCFGLLLFLLCCGAEARVKFFGAAAPAERPALRV